ncbi:MoaB/Mog domain-containing protein [Phascolomyces articulosus]|uniref:MoaB/Mog domain-containing protein n=1 Tax=Phascolomyces articulosus TaxID=60185 RepID=A0AAD5KKP2_9FUNG|nr:MoaB/Mog domain-containing protein [Phascolomyces articulosus]
MSTDASGLFTVGILTVSDTSSLNATKDKSGPLLVELLTETQQYNVQQKAIVPDEITLIQKTVEHWCDNIGLNLVLITGGTGFAPRDQTPEAVIPLLDRLTPGITHVLLASSTAITPFAALSRPVTGIRKNSLVVTFPGSPKACKENLSAILNILPHGLDLLKDQQQNTSLHKHHHGHGHKHHHHHKGHHSCVHRSDTHGHHEGRSISLDAPVSQRARTSPYPIIPVDEAESLVAKYAHITETVSVPVSQELLGHVLAEDVKAVEAVPGYRASIVDGYAVRASQSPGVYIVGSVSLASDNDPSSLTAQIPADHIVRIATGGMVPAGMDAVVMVEDTRLIEASEDGKEEKRVEILVKTSSGENIREIGSDCEIGTEVGYKGQTISTVGGELGVLASVGIRNVNVYRKPRVGVLSTGNEVVDHVSTAELKQGEIRDTNRITLLGAIKTAGFEAVDLGIIKDKVQDIESRLQEALDQVDVLITTGGVSMGEADFMKPVLEQKIGAKVHFGRVKMKPGKPTTFATREADNKLIFALPGNPASATVTFYLFVLPGLRKMAGYPQYANPVIPVEITNDVSLDPRPEYHRVRISVSGSKFIADSTGGQRSSRMLSLRQANGLLKLPAWTEEKQKLLKGDTVPCVLIGQLNPTNV